MYESEVVDLGGTGGAVTRPSNEGIDGDSRGEGEYQLSVEVTGEL